MSLENSNPAEILSEISRMGLPQLNLMEVCGTHTMAIAKSGLRSSLPENVKLLSGPGCPVCVTPSGVIDEILALAMRSDVIIATYGDMIKVPGSVHGKSLASVRALGARVEVVYSPLDAVALAEKNKGDEVVFLGAGFETTAPGTAAAIGAAKDGGITNFSVLSMLKTVEPALRALIAQEDFAVSGFLCPGHVATVIGANAFSFLAEEYNIPCVVGGFEPREILDAVYRLLLQIKSGKARLENAYPNAVRAEGNPLARKIMEKYLTPRTDVWRGLGEIPMSGLCLREEYSDFDAERKFAITYKNTEDTGACRCGDVICGRLSPHECPMFGKACTPENPVGPCMVSGEGACAAMYKYM